MPGFARALPVHKNCPCPACEPAEERPRLHVLFGDKDARRLRGDDKDVKVAEMIAHDEAFPGDFAADSHMDVHDALKPFRAAMDRHPCFGPPSGDFASHAGQRSSHAGQTEAGPERPFRRLENPVRTHSKKRAFAAGCRTSRSSRVRKSMVPNCLSRAGGPQTFAPMAR